MTHEETPRSREAVLSLATTIERAIPGAEVKPRLVESLPQDGLDYQSIRYLRNHTVLNHHFFLADENILLLNLDTEAVLGSYSTGEGTQYLLMVRYPSEEQRRKAFNSFENTYMPDAEQAAIQTEGGLWTVVAQGGCLLAIVFDSPCLESARLLLESACSGEETGS